MLLTASLSQDATPAEKALAALTSQTAMSRLAKPSVLLRSSIGVLHAIRVMLIDKSAFERALCMHRVVECVFSTTALAENCRKARLLVMLLTSQIADIPRLWELTGAGWENFANPR